MAKHWISIHIFYHGDQNHLLVNCVAPLVADLRAQRLIRRYFFIKYWVEGPHVRLRLLPTSDADDAKIRQIAEQAITAYLRRRPALYRMDQQAVAPFYKDLFVIEYGEAKWEETYGKEGSMPFYPNNSFAYIDYEPEYGRYGGAAGVEMAEWHFEYSSDTVIGLLRETNVNVRSMLLGRSVQLALPFFYGIFGDDESVLSALDRYIANWQKVYPWRRRNSQDQQAKRYQRMAPILQERITQIRRYMLEEYSTSDLTETEKSWKQHISELRQNIDHLYREQRLIPGSQNRPEIPSSLNEFYHYLLSSYIHMTNNRLGVSIPEEVYVAYLLKRTLEDLLTSEKKEALVL